MLRVAARLSRAVTQAREKNKFQPTRMGVERAEGPSQESRGQRPLVGFQRAKPFGRVHRRENLPTFKGGYRL